ncbi:hypothetical protein BDZ91DRAFT_98848 [Kalaharituber pfeilii]|nr:hypothetical protein BDZ91DRAFT_98848 [Kalaharituber pfeilii]
MSSSIQILTPSRTLLRPALRTCRSSIRSPRNSSYSTTSSTGTSSSGASSSSSSSSSGSGSSSSGSMSPRAVMLYSYIIGSCTLPFVAPAVERRKGNGIADGTRRGGLGLHHCCH